MRMRCWKIVRASLILMKFYYDQTKVSTNKCGTLNFHLGTVLGAKNVKRRKNPIWLTIGKTVIQ
jgi:hypothetical protein